MRILITRPQDDAQHTAKDLAVHGIESLIAPLFEPEYLHPSIPPRDYQAVIFTSRHAARNFLGHYPIPHIPAFCVGSETAAILENTPNGTGFSEILSADADAIALRQLINDTITDKTRPILRLHADLDDDFLQQWLIQDGYDVERVILYTMHPAKALSPQAIQAICDKNLDGICFYSPNAARHFTKLLQDAALSHPDISEACRFLTAWCISNNTKAALDMIPFGTISVSDHPTHHAMVMAMSKNCEQK